MLMNHLQFEAAVLRHVTFDRNSTEVFKKLDKMRGRCNNHNYTSAGGHHHCHINRSVDPITIPISKQSAILNNLL